MPKTSKNAAHRHDYAHQFSDAEARALKTLLIAHGQGGTTPVPNPPPGPGDITAPTVSGVSSSVTTTTATIVATTDEAATVQVEYSTTGMWPGTLTAATSSGTSHSRTLTGLTPGQTYVYRIRATDTAGNLRLDGNRTFTTTSAPTLPGAPTGLTATGGNTSVALAWTAPASNGGSAITGYRIYRNGASLIVLGNVTSYNNTGLTNGLTYSYTVAAITAVGEGPQSASAFATPSAGGDINPPIISNIAISGITTTSATVGWNLSEAGNGQVAYGLTTGYGSLTTLEAGYLTSHSQSITGLSPNTTYHLQVRSADAAGNLAVSSDRTFTTGTTTPPPPAPTTLVYGSGVGYETKSNERLDGNRESYRFRASQSSNAVSVAVNIRTGSGYSLGTGGTVKASLQTDSGGVPSGTILGSVTWSPGNPGTAENKDHHSFGSPVPLTAGTLYHLVTENTDASPAANFVSVNVVLAWNPADTPRQPAFSDDFATLRRTSAWGLQNGYLAVFDIEYANGQHDGNMYFAVITGQEGIISGSNNMCRCRFTVSGGTRTVNAANVQVRRNSGTDALIVRLEQSDGTLIESVSIPASSIAVVAASDVLTSVRWTRVPFTTPRTLTNGSTYNLRLSTASGSQYSVMPLRWLDSDMGNWDGYHFRDGAGGNGSSGQETTNGSTWVDLYTDDPSDIGFYFEVA